MCLGALLVQQHYDVSDRAAVRMIPEKPHLQYFCGITKYDSELLTFDPSALVHFQNRLELTRHQRADQQTLPEVSARSVGYAGKRIRRAALSVSISAHPSSSAPL
ncbi:MAG: transposase [Clostridia bacterium]|nr:transposase [Clostridia bacterium]